MISLRKTLSEAHEALTAQSVSHALIGGFALAAYGQHRATADIDFLADGTKRELIRSSLESRGFVVVNETSEVIQFQGVGYLDILLANRPLSQKMLSHAIENQELGIYVVRPEDIIGLKIQAYKNDRSRELQDKADIQKLLELPDIDLGLVRTYADLFDEWAAIQMLMRMT